MRKGERGNEGEEVRRGREGVRDGGREGRRMDIGRDGEREGGKEGRRKGTRAKMGNQLVYYICIHLLDPHWTTPRQTVISNTNCLINY